MSLKSAKGVDEELKALQLDVPKRGKSPDQLKKHSLDSQIENKPIERAIFLLTKGDELQKLSVIQSLSQLTQIDPQASYTRIIPIVQQQLPTSSSELHLRASKVFKELMEKKVPINLMPSTFQGIENRDPTVSNAWLETLLSIIPTLALDNVQRLIIPLATQKGRITESPHSKVASARILGAICTHSKIDAVEIKKSILPVLHGLYHDPHIEVRAAICSQIPLVAKGLTQELIVQNLLPCLVELASDNEQLVRVAAVPVLIDMFPFLSQETIKNTLVPLSKKLCERSLKYEDVSGVIVAHEIGALLKVIRPFLSNSEAVWFLNCFNVLAHRGLAINPGEIHRIDDSSQDVLCRQECAFNLPAVTDFVVVSIHSSIDVLYSVFRSLAADPCYIVRRTVAGGIHEIAKLLADKSKLIKNDFVRLLRDDAEEVLQSLVPKIATSLTIFRKYGMLSRDVQDQTTVEIGRALIKCHMELGRSLNWRLATEFLLQLEHLPTCMPNDFIHSQFTPLVLRCAVNGRAKPFRIQATRTLLIFLRNNIKVNQRQWIREKIFNELCYSDSCYTRAIYIQLCYHAMRIFSAKYFKEVFFLPLLKLADDPVSNIRGGVYKLFPSLKLMLTREDGQLQTIFEETLKTTSAKSQPKDIIETLKKVLREMAKPVEKKQKDVADAREKVLIADEDKVAKGKPLPLPDSETENVPHPNQTNLKVENIQQNNRQTAPAPKTLPQSKPPSSTSTPQSEMHFLEQHFYIDAGINLPTRTLQLENNSPSLSPPPKRENLCDDLISALSISTQKCGGNITDDVKVNLRKIEEKRSLVAPKNYNQLIKDTTEKQGNINKRHSSIFSVSCLDDKKILKRRSLNLNPKDMASKIPVCTKPKTPVLTHKSSIPVKVTEKKSLQKSKLQQPKCLKSKSYGEPSKVNNNSPKTDFK